MGGKREWVTGEEGVGDGREEGVGDAGEEGASDGGEDEN